MGLYGWVGLSPLEGREICLGGEGYSGGQNFLGEKGRGWIWRANGRYPANMQD